MRLIINRIVFQGNGSTPGYFVAAGKNPWSSMQNLLYLRFQRL